MILTNWSVAMKLVMIIFLTSNIFASELTAMQNACENSVAEACYELANIYSGENKLEPNIEKAKKYYTKACALDHSHACIDLDKLIEGK